MVLPGVGSKRRILIVRTKNYIFVCSDNGILTKVLEKEISEEIAEVKNKKFFLKEISFTLHGRDIMAPVAGYISKGIPLSCFGPKVKRKNFSRINTSYIETEPGKPLVIWGSRNFLEIAVNCGRPDRFFRIKKGEKVIVDFSP